MKKTLSKKKIIFSKIPNSKTNRNNLNFSLKGPCRILSKNKNDSINKETIDGSCIETQTFAFNQDSLNNSKGTTLKNYSLGKIDNKLIIFTSSLKNDFDRNFKLQNYSKNIKSKASQDFYSDNFSSAEEDYNNINKNNKNTIKENDSEEDNTNRIDYRYYPKIPEIESTKENNYFWFATYDKLMKKSKIVKILNYYTESSSNKKKEIFINDKNEKDENNINYNFKEKSLVIEGYEIYFLKKFDRPFVRPKKGGNIFVKLFLLNVEQINKIFSYINRLEYKRYINNLGSIKEKNYFKIISKSNKSIYNYSTLICIGSFVNINIFLLSHIKKIKNKNNKPKISMNDLPSSNKIAKLIKILLLNFPEYSKEYFIDYLIKPFEKYFELNITDKEILNHKKNEISSLLISEYKKNNEILQRKKNSTNNIIKNIIQKIPTYSQSSNKTPDDFYNFSEDISGLNDKSNINNKNKEINNNIDFFNKINLKQYKSDNDFNFKRNDMNFILNKKLIKIYHLRNTLNEKHIKNLANKYLKDETIFKQNNNNTHNEELLIKTMEPIKKTLTRHNSLRSYTQNNDSKLKKKYNIDKIINNKSKNNKENKENNMKILNTNSNFEINKNKNYMIKTDFEHVVKNTRNVIKSNPFNLTNTNDINERNYSKKTRNKTIYNEPVRVLSSIRKVISQKINSLSGNNTSSINFSNLNLSNSNSSFLGKKNIIINNELNNNLSIPMHNNKLVIKTNNNSQNKKSEYITPRKKKFIFYYQ
jgi:hypothetical protein